MTFDLSPLAPPYLAQVSRALALVERLQARALAALLAGDRDRSKRLEARAARIERFADVKARGWW